MSNEKTANVILVYQYIRKLVYQKNSRVSSRLRRSHNRLAPAQGYAPSVGKPTREVEPLDSGAAEVAR